SDPKYQAKDTKYGVASSPGDTEKQPEVAKAKAPSEAGDGKRGEEDAPVSGAVAGRAANVTDVEDQNAPTGNPPRDQNQPEEAATGKPPYDQAAQEAAEREEQAAAAGLDETIPEEQTEPEPPSFKECKTFRDLVDFSEPYLKTQGRT